MNQNACSVTLSARNALDTRMDNARPVLMGTTCQEQLARNAILGVPLAMVHLVIIAQDARKDFSSMLPQIPHGLQSKTLQAYVELTATRMLLDGIMY